MVQEKRLTSIRINKNLYAHLQQEAKKQNRSVNNYIETILLENWGKEPNEHTIEAMAEAGEMAKSGTGKTYRNADDLVKDLLDG